MVLYVVSYTGCMSFCGNRESAILLSRRLAVSEIAPPPPTTQMDIDIMHTWQAEAEALQQAAATGRDEEARSEISTCTGNSFQ